MKTLLILFCLMIGVFCKAQLQYHPMDAHLYEKPNFVELEKDTIPVILLICDTSEQIDITESYIIDDIISGKAMWHYEYDTINWGYNYVAYWRLGYEVFEKQHINAWVWNLETETYRTWRWAHLKYLDSEKKEFDKNILIWMSTNR